MDVSDGNAICLPNDLLLDILARLPARLLAGCRRVCRAWRAIVDAHDLLLPYYFPRRDFPGIFVSKSKSGCRSVVCSFFGPLSNDKWRYCKPSSRRPVYPYQATIRNSCNGLLFLEDQGNYYVFNPATARYARLPCPSKKRHIGAMTLAFDPAVSLHYEVYLLHEDKLALALALDRDVPPPVVPLEVYSSRTSQWEIREFTPGPCAPGHLYYELRQRMMIWTRNIITYERSFWSSHYWRDSIYMHSIANVLMILRSSKRTYEIVQLPGKPCLYNAEDKYPLPNHSVLASYDSGVHYVAIKERSINELQLQVWMLTESTDGQLGWTLAHSNANLRLHADMLWSPILEESSNVRWRVVGSRGGPIKLVEDDGGYGNVKDGDGARAYDSDCSWDSDEDNFVDVAQDSADLMQSTYYFDCRIIGFHPHKKALILLIHRVVVLYHLDTLRMQVLGPQHEFMGQCHVNGSFIYRGCYADVLPAGGKISKP